jgi:LysR family nitrogen assimilation transcriptional regulator
MELRQLRYVIGISEAGSLLAASRALHVVQPALSHQVALLERELGTPLFVRSHRGMRLTPAGHAFVEHARVVLQDVERLRSSVGEAHGQIGGPVVLGLPTTVALVATLPILGEVLARHPGVQLKLIESHSGFLGEWLQAGRLDAAFLFAGANRPGVAERELLEERLVFVSHPDAAPASLRLSLRALCQRPLVLPAKDHGLRRIVDEACAQAGLSLTLVAEIDSLPNIKKAVQAGLAATILSPGAVSDEVQAGLLAVAQIGSPTLLRRVVVSHSLTRPMSPAAAAVLQAAEDVVREMVRTQAWPARWVGDRRD